MKIVESDRERAGRLLWDYLDCLTDTAKAARALVACDVSLDPYDPDWRKVVVAEHADNLEAIAEVDLLAFLGGRAVG